MKTSTLLYFLFLLILYDFITTYIGVLYMGATELNPIYVYCDNIEQWLLFKFMVGVFCLSVLSLLYHDKNKRVVRYGIICLNIVYFVVAISNTTQIIMNI